jgi:hypothetical protein
LPKEVCEVVWEKREDGERRRAKRRREKGKRGAQCRSALFIAAQFLSFLGCKSEAFVSKDNDLDWQNV